MKSYLLFITTSFCLALPSISFANTDIVKVQNLMKKYTSLISCNNEIKQKNIINMTNDESYQPLYYVLWQGDIGCAGGSGTTSMNITAVEKNSSESVGYLVSTYPVINDDIYYSLNPRHIESIKKISSNQIQVISWEAANDNEINFPSRKVQYNLNRKANNSDWKITNKTIISKR